ncbi:STAS-like domain-containing protein [Patescibacteria group bacterium]|nr:STAS-like domain-containing protein [Patescibacteria group bacterium]MBU1016127.1 STAS-like domain-containing protein [Patescibacteria group bacterium]MBU1684870.1 STAS-like domain-containing protein [Patescibacteria group bacterium]MBU1938586.1 STAS-like domain-containing protein [Patescibacteria group bacterium]
MHIQLKQFGSSLSSRQAGKDAYGGFQTMLTKMKPNEPIEIDFEGVSSLSPSWADEFLTPLANEYDNKVILFNTKNLSVDATITFLEEINKLKFNRKS